MITLSLEKIKYNLIENNQKNENIINLVIKSYYNYIDTNSFSDLKCPNCKCKNSLSFHKYYQRNLTFYAKETDTVCDIIVNIAVLECSNCKRRDNTQKYHALLPYFILPYHIYEASTIIETIKDYLNKIKLTEILEKIRITHKLFYDWLKKFNKYELSTSIIVKEQLDSKILVNKIFTMRKQFFWDFFEYYYHPYFLFRSTCVPLCIRS